MGEAYGANSTLGGSGSVKAVTISRSGEFDVRVRYTNSSVVANKQADIASYTVPAQTTTDGSVPKIKARIHMTANGIFVLESAARLTEVEDDTPAPAPAPAEGEAAKEGE